MMKHNLKICFGALIILLFAGSMPAGKDGLLWSAGRKLTWNDFRQKAPKQTDLVAMTYSTIYYGYSGENNKLVMNITATFDKETSWTRDDTSRYLLNHEQLHFDITEIYARRFRKKLTETSFTRQTFQTKIRQFHQDNINAWKKYQDAYDKETNHSINKSAQAEWDAKVAKELEELSGFGETELVLTVE